MGRQWIDDVARESVDESISRRSILGKLAVGLAGAGVGALAGGAGKAAAAPAIKCPPGLTNCNGLCRVTSIDPDNCGGCSIVCAADQICRGGTCVYFCTAGETLCNGVCVDLQADPANCGTCGNACGANEVCENGVCVSGKPNGQSCTSGSECRSGFCVGGVCCDTACTGACATCATGTCSPRPSSFVCRPQQGPCDLAESCDGASLECPPDAFAPAGTSCDDFDLCTTDDVCDGAGNCIPGSPVVCDDGNECTSDHCLASGACAFVPLPNGTACTGGVCQDGVCVPA